MREIPERFRDRDLDETKIDILRFLVERDEPDTEQPRIEREISDSDSFADVSQRTIERRSKDLHSQGILRHREVTEHHVQMYGLAHPESSWGVPGDLEVEEMRAAREAVERVADHIMLSLLTLSLFSLVIVAEVVAGATPAWFQFQANDTLVLGLMILAAVGGFYFSSPAIEDLVERTPADIVRVFTTGLRRRIA